MKYEAVRRVEVLRCYVTLFPQDCVDIKRHFPPQRSLYNQHEIPLQVNYPINYPIAYN